MPENVDGLMTLVCIDITDSVGINGTFYGPNTLFVLFSRYFTCERSWSFRNQISNECQILIPDALTEVSVCLVWFRSRHCLRTLASKRMLVLVNLSNIGGRMQSLELCHTMIGWDFLVWWVGPTLAQLGAFVASWFFIMNFFVAAAAVAVLIIEDYKS